MNGWTHFSSLRLWFTCKAAATEWAPSSEIWLDPRLQDVRKWQIRSQKYSNVIKKVKHKSPWVYMCSNLPPNHAKKAHPWKLQPPFVACSANCMFQVPSTGFPYHFSTYPGTTLQCTLLKKYKKDMNYWTHSSSWRVWFTCNAPANSRAPMFEIWL